MAEHILKTSLKGGTAKAIPEEEDYEDRQEDILKREETEGYLPSKFKVNSYKHAKKENEDLLIEIDILLDQVNQLKNQLVRKKFELINYKKLVKLASKESYNISLELKESLEKNDDLTLRNKFLEGKVYILEAFLKKKFNGYRVPDILNHHETQKDGSVKEIICTREEEGSSGLVKEDSSVPCLVSGLIRHLKKLDERMDRIGEDNMKIKDEMAHQKEALLKLVQPWKWKAVVSLSKRVKRLFRTKVKRNLEGTSGKN